MSTDEARRLESLRSYRILDTEPEKQFDDLTRLAAYICRTPMALVSLVDAERQWFKSRTGLDATETPRDVAFCAHAIKESAVFVVPDALQDDRFRDNPLVTSGPRIRFYAGAPLITRDGHALGTLCVIDVKPRKLSKEQIEALDALRSQTVAQLELRRNLMDLKQALEERDASEAMQTELIEELQESLASVKKLGSMIPFCSSCKFDMTFKAEPASIDTVVEGVKHVLSENGWAEGREFEVETALREALANAIRHGCNNDASKQIQCCVSLEEDGELVIVVRDPGSGFDATGVPDPREKENRTKTSGRGIFLINELMDEVRFDKGGREVRMRKNAGEAAKDQ